MQLFYFRDLSMLTKDRVVFFQKWQNIKLENNPVLLNLLQTISQKALNHYISVEFISKLFVYFVLQFYFHFGDSVIELDLTKDTIFSFKNGKKLKLKKIVVSLNLLCTYHFTKVLNYYFSSVC